MAALCCTEGGNGILYTLVSWSKAGFCMILFLFSVYFSGTEAYFPSRYTGTLTAIRELIDNVNCTGTESKLSDCSHSIILQNSYTSPRVQCQHGEQDHCDILMRTVIL